MLSFLRRADDGDGQIGVFDNKDGLAVAQVLTPPQRAKPVLSYCAFEGHAGDDDLARAVRNLPNRKLPAVGVLASRNYHMLLVEAPDVPADELKAAVRWRVKDLIDFHVDDAVIDVFQMPQQGRGGPNQMMYAIAARADAVRAQVHDAEEAGLNLEVIDILELSLRNVAALVEEDSRGVALLYIDDSSSVLLLVRQGVLYLSRRIDTGQKTLNEVGALRSELVAGLALETRRSLDYFESHYEQNSIPVLYTSGLDPSDLDQMGRELAVSVRNIELRPHFEIETLLAEDMERKCLPAIGAALRKDTPTL